MQCVKPLTLQDKMTAGQITVPCGRCMPCRITRTQEWAHRIVHEQKISTDSSWVTLTYDDEHLPEFESLDKRHLQLYFKSLRKAVGKLRYYVSGEYGDQKERPHYHLCLFGVPETNPFIRTCWPHGHVMVGKLTERSAAYTAKYIQKKLYGPLAIKYVESGRLPEFALMSRRPGIGIGFAKKYLDNWVSNGYMVINGIKRPIPSAYTNRLPKEVKTLLHEKRQKARLEKIASVYRETSVDCYRQADKEVQSRPQRLANLEAMMKLKPKGVL